jgi:hypothetical protein
LGAAELTAVSCTESYALNRPFRLRPPERYFFERIERRIN